MARFYTVGHASRSAEDVRRRVARGHDVVDVFGPDRADEHELTRFAEVRDGRVVYPADDAAST
ncbi:hypothetical protein ACFQPA_04505 [Halomarina halobia]|uniref:Uncharacterized protein n=1 Tax=Halomarina halobia TaxID=3033386 RepID=A0ABD6A645_9EURY|nr:hypothetical protein [Halomarina sp. PSR21]